MSLTAIFILDVIMLTAIGFFVWSYCRGTRISTLELVATYKLNLRDTERKIRLAVEERIARVDLNEKRLNQVESRVDRLSGRSEKTVIKLAEKEIARRKRKQRSRKEIDREYLGLVSLSEVKKMSGSDSSRARDAFEQDLLSQRMKLYAGQNV